MIRGTWNGFNYEYPNGIVSPYRIEIKSITAYKLDGVSRYRIEYHDGTVEDQTAGQFTDGQFLFHAVAQRKVEHHKAHNGEFTVYRGYEYDARVWGD
jgi:hypothetical protein